MTCNSSDCIGYHPPVGIKPPTELDRLYWWASDSEAEMLDDLRVRAGLVWRCRTEGWLNVIDLLTCEECGASRPRED